MAATSNIEVFAGETPTITFGPVTDATGVVINLTDASLVFSTWRSGQPSTRVLSKSTEDSPPTIIVLDQTTSKGLFSITLLAADTATQQGSFQFDVAISIAGVRSVIADGYLLVSRAVSPKYL